MVGLNPKNLIYINQIHSSKVIKANFPGNYDDADGIINEGGNLVCSIKVADCLPIFFINNNSKTIGLVHAGWRGLSLGIINEFVNNIKNKEKEALEFYGRNLGLTFQIADDTLDYNSELKLFGKKIGQDFYEGKITLPIILLFQKAADQEKRILKDIFSIEKRNEDNLDFTLTLIKKYDIIKACYQKAQHYINLAHNSLSVFSDSKEKIILENLTSFSLARNF